MAVQSYHLWFGVSQQNVPGTMRFPRFHDTAYMLHILSNFLFSESHAISRHLEHTTN
jgi:hypothetical protein